MGFGGVGKLRPTYSNNLTPTVWNEAIREWVNAGTKGYAMTWDTVKPPQRLERGQSHEVTAEISRRADAAIQSLNGRKPLKCLEPYCYRRADGGTNWCNEHNRYLTDEERRRSLGVTTAERPGRVFTQEAVQRLALMGVTVEEAARFLQRAYPPPPSPLHSASVGIPCGPMCFNGPWWWYWLSRDYRQAVNSLVVILERDRWDVSDDLGTFGWRERYTAILEQV